MRYLKQIWLPLVLGILFGIAKTWWLVRGYTGGDAGMVIPGVFAFIALEAIIVLFSLQALVFRGKIAKIVAVVVLGLVAYFEISGNYHARHPYLYCNGSRVSSYVGTSCEGE